MSVPDAASALKFSDWSRHTSDQLAKRLKGLGIAPGRGKPRRQAQLNLLEMGAAWFSSSRNSSSTVAAAEDRLVELYRLRISEARDLANKYGITSAAEVSHTRHFVLVKFIFVYEFLVALRDNLADSTAQITKAGTSANSVAAAANNTAGSNACSTILGPLEARPKVLRDHARPARDGLTQVDRDLLEILNAMDLEISLVNETTQ